MQKLFRELPKITEADLIAEGKHDAICPICYNAFLAVLAEEETAHAMDSPAHPIDELGVTKLQKTCGHMFCRKDIMRWISEGHDSCPNCRTPLLTDAERRGSGSPPPAGDWFRPWIVHPGMVARDQDISRSPSLPILPVNFSATLGMAHRGEGNTGQGQDNRRHEFSGMYS
ncbi:hypothetical protein ID866_2478 [Astraeus odoratus]|nr:hypothetical protein ID866_2478 [Astraeus odoratus]